MLMDAAVIGCSACNPFDLRRKHSPPSFPPTTTTAATVAAVLLITSPFHHHRDDKRLILHVQPHKHSGFSHLTPLNFSNPHLHYNINDDGYGGGGGGGGSGDDGSNNFFHFDRNPFSLFPFHFIFSKEEHLCPISLPKHVYLLLISISASLSYFIFASSAALAKTDDLSSNHEEIVFEIRGGKRVELVPDYSKDEFIIPEHMWSWWSKGGKSKSLLNLTDVWMKCRDLATSLMLPEGFPESVTSDYLEYSLWRGVQGIAAQISGVLATQVVNFCYRLLPFSRMLWFCCLLR